ncbi:MAG: cellulase family glycosylhydrolase [Chloroflexi bacterium]|nr:cellulase family glycosylhydrolase [Chloroflexota bacterium]
MRRITFIILISLLAASCLPAQDAATQIPPVPATVSPTIAAPAETPPSLTSLAPAPGFLRVQGRDILDDSGQSILLRGISMDTYYYSYLWDPAAPQSYATQADIQYLDSLGVTVIRLGLHWRYFDTSLGYDLIDDYLAWCEQAGIYVILDMHVVPPEDDILQGKIWDDPAAQQQFLDLWTAIATRYADRKIIAGYDIYNEPAPSEAAQWWKLVERTRTAIRAVDNNHILFVENPLSEDGGFQLLADPNVVYSFHDYEPFLVSHAGAEWVGDSPVPDDYAYPGPSLTGVEWANWSEGAAVFTSQTSEWVYWDSGVLTVPPNVEFATLKPGTDGDAGAVWFDDLEVEHNGVPQTIYNPGMEEASINDASRPANWGFWSDSGFSGEWSSEQAHSGTHSLKITSDGNGFGVWTQSEWIFTAPLFRVQSGDTFRVRGWVYAPHNNGGVSLGLDYLNGVYENYDRAQLLANMQPYLDWAAANNVLLYVGEFGAAFTAPGDSRYNLAEDKISVMNEAHLHWTMWSYREASTQSFGLFFGDDVDERLADILRLGLGLYASQ